MTSSPIDDQTLREVALTREEYDLIVQRLGRHPRPVELGMFGALWSEHCGYKNSKPVLRLFPTTGPRVVQGPGENAGAVDIGDGLAAVFKAESHNHPSAVEPFQGAATGVGGIIRDIFTMGARPIAILDSLRFGPLDEPRNRYLFQGVVGGIAHYGNCIGIPTVGGDIQFAAPYSGNPLVNAMCVGIVETKRLVRATASGPGNTLMLVGADTGRDGIHGATFASVELSEESEERRPAVQVGNPFLEKLLLEACLELLQTDHIVGMQDLGAAGITSSAVESAARAGTGVDIDVRKVSRREQGMTAYEVMLSESQERMLVVVKQGHEDAVRAIFDRWGLHSDIIGHVTDEPIVRVRDGDEIVAEIPTELLMTPPIYQREGIKPDWLDGLQQYDLDALPDVANAEQTLLDLLGRPTIASKECVYRRYDHQVLTNTVIGPGGDAAVLRIKGTKRAIAVKTDCNGRMVYLDPFAGGAIAVAEACRNVTCTGAEPLAITDCLNFGNPEKPEIFYQLRESVLGISEACRTFETPVVSGNVSLYNETNGEPVYPTPLIGVVGLIEDVERVRGAGFTRAGDVVAVVGCEPGTAGRGATGAQALAGSEYLEMAHGLVAGQPSIDLPFEAAVQRVVRNGIRTGLVHSAHDCSDGGLAVALAESAMLGRIGATLAPVKLAGRLDAVLFGEAQSRIVVTVAPEDWERLTDLAAAEGIPVWRLGTTGGDRLTWQPWFDVPVEQLTKRYSSAIPDLLKAETPVA